MMAGEPPQHQGKDTEGGDLSIVSRLHSEGSEGGVQTGQRRHQGGASVVPGRTIHEYRPRQRVRTLLRLEPHREQVQRQASMRLLLRTALHQRP